MILCGGTAVVLVLLWFAVNGIISLVSDKTDTSKGLEYIEKAEEADITAIEKKITQLERQEKSEDDTRSIKEKFTGAVVVGDSIAEGFEGYGVLNPSNVVAKIGAHLSEIEDEIDQIKDLSPKIIFLSVGTNDVNITNGDTDEFIRRYKKLLENIKDEIPDAHIYVNSMFPVQQKAVAEDPALAKIGEYNVVLEELCETMRVGYIDNSSIVEEQYYEQDGIHFKGAFYTIWAEHMAKVAVL